MTIAPSSYPPLLQAQVSHAHRFAHTLRALREDASPADASWLWLEGRADEVSAFTSDVIRAWSSAEVPADAAARAIEDYLRSLHVPLEEWYGRCPSCCGPISSARPWFVPLAPRRFDSLADTMADAPAPSVGGGA
jgi:hypothetical protein